MPTSLDHESTFRRRLRLRLHHQLRRLTLLPLVLVLALILALLGVTAYLLNAEQLVDHTHEVLVKISHVHKLALDMESGVRGYRITNDAAFLEPFQRASAALPAELDALNNMVRDNPSQHTYLQQLRDALRGWNEFAARVQERVAAGLPSDVTNQLRGKTLMDAVRAHIDLMEAHEHDLLRKRSRNAAWVRMLIMPAILLAGILFAPMLIISIRRTLAFLDASYRAAWDESDRQRERLEVTLASIGDGVIATDATGTVAYLNPVAEALTGWSSDEVHGKPLAKVFNIIHEHTRDSLDSPAALVLRDGNIEALVDGALLIAKDGREIPIADSAAPIRDPLGQITGAVMVFRDQTRERVAMKDIAEKARLLDLTNDGIIMRNLEGFIVYWNNGAEKIYGWSREEALGKRSHDLLHTEFLVPGEQITEELYRTGHWMGEFIHQTRDGRRITVLARKALDRDSHGNPAVVMQSLTDITKRKQEEEALAKIAAIIESSNDAIISKDLQGIITSWNEAAERLFGYTAEEAIGQSVTLLIPTDHANEEPHILARIRSGEPIKRYETIRRRKNGELVDVSLTVSPVRNNAGEIIGASKIVRDITERKRAEHALRESEKRFRDLAELLPQKIFTTGPAGELEYLNSQWSLFTGLEMERIQGGGWLQLMHADDVEETISRWKHSIETGDHFELEHRFRRHDGVYCWHVTRAQALKGVRGEPSKWIGSSTDIDDVIRAQEELLDAQTQLADRAVQLEALVQERTSKLDKANARLLAEADERKRLEAEIAEAVEGERERLGQELHDGLAQELAGIGMLLHVLERQMTPSSPTFSTEAGKLCLMVEKAQENARNLAKSFYPVELEMHGLLVALQNFALHVHERFGTMCVVEAGPNAPARLKDAAALQLFRIAQEAVHNAVKHADATEITITLEERNAAWLLTIKDDGLGLPGEAQGASGMGLRIMQYRARLIGGTVDVCNAIDGGVLVSCSVPAAQDQ